MIYSRTLLSFLLLLLITGFWPLQHTDEPISGFRSDHIAEQHALEARFDDQLQAANLESWMRTMTAKPQHTGSPHTKANAEFVAALFESWGYESEIEVFHVLFPTPLERIVELVEPVSFKAKLEEPALPEDASTSVREDMLPPYNAYSADGDVTAELVYVNYGIPEDYERLEQMGISVEGKIVIARYGRSWRGIKPKLAAEHGAIGCILYSDPYDDGYRRGDVYPEGPFRNEHSVQRGSVSDMPQFPGDPLTPGVGAKEDTDRLAIEDAPTIMKIPVLPISYGDALPLLEAIGGPVAPANWHGVLPITYHIGPGPAKVRLKLRFSWDIVPAYNTVARLEGSTYPDEWIMRGNHRDAWVFGAADPTSGAVALMEEARAIGELAKEGWRPKRTLVYATWDAEEPGLLGSTEWAEYHAEELQRKLVAYINTDGNGRGFLGMGGSHTLERFINEVARDVEDPQTGVSVADRLRARLRVSGNHTAAGHTDLRIGSLGSGSDYTPFIQHLGIASLNLGYGGEGGGGSYHSAYDTFEYYTRFGDPGFAYGIALAKTAGRATLRLANADILPFKMTNFAETVQRFGHEVMDLTDTMREETARLNAMLVDNAFMVAADPTKTYVAPAAEVPVPFLNFAPLQNALNALQQQAASTDSALNKALSANMPNKALEEVNQRLLVLEQSLTSTDGLPNRNWFRHQIYAPGFYTGYGVKTLPGIREAIESRDWDLAAVHVNRVAEILNGFSANLKEIENLVSE